MSVVTPAQAFYILRLVNTLTPEAGKHGFAGFIPGFAPQEDEKATVTAGKMLSVSPGRAAVDAALDYVVSCKEAKVKCSPAQFWSHLKLRPLSEAAPVAQAQPRAQSQTVQAPLQAASVQAPLQAAPVQSSWTPDKVMEAVKIGLMSIAEGRKLLGLDAPVVAAPVAAAQAPVVQPAPVVAPARVSLDKSLSAYKLLLDAQAGEEVDEEEFGSAEALIKGLTAEQVTALHAAIKADQAAQAREALAKAAVTEAAEAVHIKPAFVNTSSQPFGPKEEAVLAYLRGDSIDVAAPAGADPAFGVSYGYAEEDEIPF